MQWKSSSLHIYIKTLIHILFPQRDSQKQLAAITTLTPQRTQKHVSGVVVTYFFKYEEPATRALITEAKFHNNTHAQRLLGTALRSMMPDLHTAMVIPMPLSRTRLRERGYNQMIEILHAGGLPCTTKVLTRRHRRPQTDLDRHERLKNQLETFSVTAAGATKIPNAHIILVDDVITTGATMCAAYAALEIHHPASITCLALAH